MSSPICKECGTSMASESTNGNLWWYCEKCSDECGWCFDDPAKGFAEIDGRRYCHEGDSPTCYELAQRK